MLCVLVPLYIGLLNELHSFPKDVFRVPGQTG